MKTKIHFQLVDSIIMPFFYSTLMQFEVMVFKSWTSR